MWKRNTELNQQAMKLMKKQAEAKEKEKPKEPAADDQALKRRNTEQMLADQEKTLKQEGGVKDKEMMEAIRIAQEAERAEEEELMRRAIEESERLEKDAQKEEEEEAELIRAAIEASAREEQARKQAAGEAEPAEVAEVKQAEVKGSAPPKDEPKPPITEPIKKVEEEKQEEPLPTPATTIPPEKLIEITGKPAMSQAELKKLEELKRLKREAKLAKQKEQAEQTERKEAIQMKADALPPVALQRKGQFEMIPDFLKKETKLD